MNNELIELALSRIAELERKLEKYYEMLKVYNELDFILNGTYIFESDIQSVLDGTY